MGKENLSLSSNRFPISRRNKRRDKKLSISFRPLQMVGNDTLPFVQKLVLTLISRGEIKRRDEMHVWRDTHSVFPPISPTRMTYFPRTLALLSPTNKCRRRKARRGRMEMEREGKTILTSEKAKQLSRNHPKTYTKEKCIYICSLIHVGNQCVRIRLCSDIYETRSPRPLPPLAKAIPPSHPGRKKRGKGIHPRILHIRSVSLTLSH